MVAAARPVEWLCPKCKKPGVRAACHTCCKVCYAGQLRRYRANEKTSGKTASLRAAAIAWYESVKDSHHTCPLCGPRTVADFFPRFEAPGKLRSPCRDCGKAAQSERDQRRVERGKRSRVSTLAPHIAAWESMGRVGPRPGSRRWFVIPGNSAIARREKTRHQERMRIRQSMIDEWDAGGRNGPRPYSDLWNREDDRMLAQELVWLDVMRQDHPGDAFVTTSGNVAPIE